MLDLVGGQEVRWEESGTVRAEDCIFFRGEGNDIYHIETGFLIRETIIPDLRQ
jgi:hypothetical protein